MATKTGLEKKKTSRTRKIDRNIHHVMVHPFWICQHAQDSYVQTKTNVTSNPLHTTDDTSNPQTWTSTHKKYNELTKTNGSALSFAHIAALVNNRKRMHIQCSKAGERM
jgi:hypothetical protein